MATKSIERLWHDRFFRAARRVSDIAERLRDDGEHPADSTLRMALARSRFLRPTRVDGVVAFIQKVPPPNPGDGDHRSNDSLALVHPDLRRVAEPRLRAGHRADAVEAALKAVNNRVKAALRKATAKDLDGTALMSEAFSASKPIIKLAQTDSQSGKDQQAGYMHLFMGAMLGIRNPKAHEFVDISEEEAVRLLVLASVLSYKLDQAGVE